MRYKRQTTTQKSVRLLAIGMGLALVVGFAPRAAAVGPLLKELEETFIGLHEEVRPCVVNIDTKGSAEMEGMGGQQFEDLFRFFGVPNPHGMQQPPRRRMPKRQGTGSGFIYDKRGHIITNNHVVEGADEILVRLWDGTELEAKLVGRDPDTDVAVIKIDAEGKDLPVVKMGDSSALRVGQYAIAMGSPRGFEGSLSFGHISALGRDELRLPGLRFQDFIQTDAAINLGNSGGPLCNIDGEVIGINVAIVYGANSLGFAIPVNTAKNVVPQLIENKKVTRGNLGVGIKDAKEFADALGLPDAKGAFVESVRPDTPAERAGLEPYDVIRKIDGQEVEDAPGLIRLISAESPDTTVDVEIWRDGEIINKKVELAEWKGSEPAKEVAKEKLGFRVRTLSAEIAEQLGLEADTKGVVITDIAPASAAEEAGLAPGYVIIEVAQKAVTDSESFFSMSEKKAKPGKDLLVGYMTRDGLRRIAIIKVPKEDKE